MSDVVRQWWRHPDRYDWLTGYLRARGIVGQARLVMGVVVAGPVLSLSMLLHSRDGAVGVGRAVAWVPTLFGVFAVLLWAVRWPTHREFIAFSIGCCSSIAMICLLLPDPRSSLISTYAFMIAGSLLALFQSPKLMLYNFVLVTAVVLIDVTRLIGDGHLALSVVAVIAVLLSNLFVPVGVYSLVYRLGTDLVQADRDPLTGLFNRRAFRNQTLNLIGSPQRGPAWLSIALIDLDAFKAVNDTHGHDAGDRVLAHVAQVLVASAGQEAIVSRNGGEEFVVATVTANDDAHSLAQRLCDAVASAAVPVTASVGSASARLDEIGALDPRSCIEELIIDADSAMYRAKRNGGNQTRHYSVHPDRGGAAEEHES